jgi:type VI secretion system protein ImpA
MAIFADLEKDISTELPCGPDPDLDPEVQNFLQVAEGQLPASYREFNKKSFDARPVLEKLQALAKKSHDLRFLVLAAKYFILSDNLKDFVHCVQQMQVLLTAHWDTCHPAEAAGGNPLRAAFLKSLDDLPTSVLPLQNALLINDKRLGIVTMRTILVADKKLPPRAEEAVVDSDAMRDAFMRFEPMQHLIDLQAGLGELVATLQGIRQLFIDKADYETAPQFDQLPEAATAIKTYLSDILRARAPEVPVETAQDAAAAEDGGEADAGASASGSAAGAIVSVSEASRALDAILAYYAANEPSSPARLLVKQAHQLVGKSFIEAMRILAPAMAEEARIKIGGPTPFALDFNQLSSLLGESGETPGGEGEVRSFEARTRAEASALMRSVEVFYKANEPSSPIPLLVERARNFVAKDFTALLREMAKPDE